MGVMDRNYIDENMNEIMDDMTSEYPYFMHVTDLTEQPFPWHWHEELELGFLDRGKARILTTEAEYHVEKGDVFYINSNSIHMLEAEEEMETVEIVNLFHPVLLSGHFHSVFETKYVRPIILNHQLQVILLKGDTDAAKKIRDCLKKIEKLHSEKDVEIFIRNLLSEAWFWLYQEISRHPDLGKNGSGGSQERIRTMISYICDHYAEKITLEDIASSASISTREANRSFKKAIGQSPIDYLTSYRLNNTQKLLTSTQDSITDIAYENGFTDSAYYSKAFKKRFGISPSEYRAKYSN